MPDQHLMACTEISSMALVFECTEGCGRRLLIDRGSGELTVAARGDFFAFHRGSLGAVEMGTMVLPMSSN